MSIKLLIGHFAILTCLLTCALGAQADTPSIETSPGPSVSDPTKPNVVDLQQALEMVMLRNPDLQAAGERVEEAVARVKQATAAFYPQVKFNYGYLHSDMPAIVFPTVITQRRYVPGTDFNNPGAIDNFGPALIGSFSLFRGGEDFYRRKSAELGVEAMILQKEALLNDLAEAATIAYYAYFSALEQVEVAKSSIKAIEGELRLMKSRYDAGTALKSEVLSLNVRQAEARDTELRANNAVDSALAAIRVLLGLSAEAPLELLPPKETAARDKQEGYSKLLVQALHQRPEMQACQRLVSMREQEVKAERAGYLPRLDANVVFNQYSNNPEFFSRNNNLTYSVVAQYELFSGFETSAKVDIAARKLEQARATMQKTRLDIEKEVKLAHLDLAEALARKDVSDAAVADADQALHQVLAQYNAGTATVSRYLDAEAAKTAANSRRIAARYDIRRAEAALKRAMGQFHSQSLEQKG